MNVQVIERDGQPEYAVLSWADYQGLLQAAGHVAPPAITAAAVVDGRPALSELKRLREAKGLAPEQLARTVGISPHYLGMIESGEREPDAAIRRSLAWHQGLPGWEGDS